MVSTPSTREGDVTKLVKCGGDEGICTGLAKIQMDSYSHAQNAGKTGWHLRWWDLNSWLKLTPISHPRWVRIRSACLVLGLAGLILPGRSVQTTLLESVQTIILDSGFTYYSKQERPQHQIVHKFWPISNLVYRASHLPWLFKGSLLSRHLSLIVVDYVLGLHADSFCTVKVSKRTML